MVYDRLDEWWKNNLIQRTLQLSPNAQQGHLFAKLYPVMNNIPTKYKIKCRDSKNLFTKFLQNIDRLIESDWHCDRGKIFTNLHIKLNQRKYQTLFLRIPIILMFSIDADGTGNSFLPIY